MLDRVRDWFGGLSSTKKFGVVVAAVLVLALAWQIRTALFARNPMPDFSKMQGIALVELGSCDDGRVIVVARYDADGDGVWDYAAAFASDNTKAPFLVYNRATRELYVDLNRDGYKDRTTTPEDPALQGSFCELLNSGPQQPNVNGQGDGTIEVLG